MPMNEIKFNKNVRNHMHKQLEICRGLHSAIKAETPKIFKRAN